MSVFGVFYAIVRQIPAGKVATYGQIARLAGMPRCARTVGYAMAGCQDATVPCHRVVDRFGGTKACFDTHSPVPSERCWRQRECFFAWTGPWTWNGVSGRRPSPYSENIGGLLTSATVSASAVSIPRKPPFSWEVSPFPMQNQLVTLWFSWAGRQILQDRLLYLAELLFKGTFL